MNLLDLIFPTEHVEWTSIHVDPYCEEQASLRLRGLTSLDRLLSACNYHSSPVLQHLLQVLKYKRTTVHARGLAELLTATVSAYADPDSVVTPVPLHWSRRYDRGFNQAHLLATYVVHDVQLSYAHLLKRHRNTGHQAWRHRTERFTAMRDAFTVRRGVQVPEHVVLIDDIATTGATLDACAHALKDAGASIVEAWVVARG